MNRKNLTHTFLVILFLIFIAITLIENLQINLLVYVGSQNYWLSRRFWIFLLYSIGNAFAIVFVLRKFFRNEPVIGNNAWLERFPIIARKAIAIALPAIVPIAFWFAPLPEKLVVGYWSRLFLMYLGGLFSAWLWPEKSKDKNAFLLRTSIFWMVGGVFYSILGRLVFVTDYPFPLHWSEGNRFFDYSILFWQQPVYSFGRGENLCFYQLGHAAALGNSISHPKFINWRFSFLVPTCMDHSLVFSWNGSSRIFKKSQFKTSINLGNRCLDVSVP